MRYDGCRAALADAGHGPPLLLKTGPAADAMEGELVALVDGYHGRFDGVVAASDVIAMTLLRVLADRGVSVPGEIRAAGYDDLPLAAHMVPRLTTVRQDLAVGAQTMIERLRARLSGEHAPSVQLTPELIMRGSS